MSKIPITFMRRSIQSTLAVAAAAAAAAAAVALALSAPVANAGVGSDGRQGAPGSDHDDNGSGVAPPHSRPLGKSYSQWAAIWWQWAAQLPATGHPMLPGGACNRGQTGKVWFLGGTFSGDGAPVVRSCQIQAGTSLLFPLVNSGYFAFTSDPPEQRTEEFLRAAAECTGAQIEVSIDGARLRDPTRYLERSVLFDVQLPLDNVFGVDSSIVPGLLLSPSVDFGYYLFLAPLRPGVHDIAWKASMTCLGGAVTYRQDNTYHITVVPNGRH